MLKFYKSNIATIKKGRTLELTPDEPCAYFVGNPNVATVDEAGVVTGHNVGMALIQGVNNDGERGQLVVMVIS